MKTVFARSIHFSFVQQFVSVVITGILIFGCQSFSELQTEQPTCDTFVNTHLAETKIYGGTSDSGISSTLTYTFLANERVTLPNVLVNDESLVLEKRDSLIVIRNVYQPYGNHHTNGQNSLEAPEVHPLVAKKNNGNYTVYAKNDEEFAQACTYTHNGKTDTVVYRKIPDVSESFYAP